jgi:hypothetical protein
MMHYVVQQNPSRAAWIFAASAAAVGIGIGTWWLLRTKRTYVGSGWNWPHRNRFPTEISFGEALATLGYGAAYGLPGWEVLSVETMNTVRQFQRDFNTVRNAFTLQHLSPEIDADGLIGEDTIKALLFALDVQESDSWISLVQDAKLQIAGVDIS